jgi:hypothetical protein
MRREIVMVKYAVKPVHKALQDVLGLVGGGFLDAKHVQLVSNPEVVEEVAAEVAAEVMG